METTLAFFGPLGGWELALIAGLGLLIFGGRLPQVARNMGKGIVEFKKGLKGIEEDIDKASDDTKRIEDKTTDTVETESTTEKVSDHA